MQSKLNSLTQNVCSPWLLKFFSITFGCFLLRDHNVNTPVSSVLSPLTGLATCPCSGNFLLWKAKNVEPQGVQEGAVTGVQGLSDRIYLALILTKELCGWAGNGTAQGECLRGHREQARSLSVLHCSLQGDIFLSPLTTVLTGASSAQKTCSLECHHPEVTY